MLSILLKIFSYSKTTAKNFQLRSEIYYRYMGYSLTLTQFNTPLEDCIRVAHLLSAKVGFWPAEVTLSQQDFVFTLLWWFLQVNLPIKTEIILPIKISHGHNSILSMSWALSSARSAGCQSLGCPMTAVLRNYGKVHLLRFFFTT